MRIKCRQCGTQFNLPRTAADKGSFKVRCSICQHVFLVVQPEVKGTLPNNIPFRNHDQIMHQPGFFNVIAISNQKGGVAKTTTCLNTGYSLSMLQKKVLLIDFDLQANLSLILGYPNAPSFYNLIESGQDIAGYIKPTPYPNLWILPSNNNMVLLNKKYFGSHSFEYILKDRLYEIYTQFDYILIDTPPSVEFFTLNALTVATQTVIPCDCAYLSTNGVHQLIKLLKLVKSKTNPAIRHRILITMHNPSLTASKVVFTKIGQLYPGQLFHHYIEDDPAIKESQIMKQPVLFYNKNSKAGQQYLNFAQEIINT